MNIKRWALALAVAGGLGVGEGTSGGTKQGAQDSEIETYSITTQGIKVTYTQADANGHPAIYATRNGKILWHQEYGAYCTKANQVFYKGFRLVLNKVIIVDCIINGNMVDSSPKSLFISPK